MLGRIFFYSEGSGVLELVIQRGSGCPIPGGVQGLVGWGPGQTGIALNMELGALNEVGGLELDDT